MKKFKNDLAECNQTTQELEDAWTELQTIEVETSSSSQDKWPQKIYVSGKISGMEDQAANLFKDAEKFLERVGYTVINPMTLNHNHDKSWESYMKEDLKALLECDAIYMLKNWIDSRGARIEHKLAKELGMHILYESV